MMRNLTRTLSLSLLLLSTVTGSFACAGAGSGGSEPLTAVELTGGYNAFGIELFTLESSRTADKNTFVSPASVALCLGMTYNGAGDITAAEMARVLRVESTDIGGYNEANGLLLKQLAETVPGVTLSIANSLWLRKDFSFRKDYIKRNETYFGAGIYQLKTAAEINRWVEQKTEGMIPSIIDSVDPADIAILVNAIYFKGIWKIRFDPEMTGDKDFLTPAGKKTVPMMKRSGDLICLENDQLQAVRLPYGEGGTSMYVLLPAEGTTLTDLAEKLDPENWETWRAAMRPREGTIELPRFRAEYFSRLNGSLGDMGMKEAFSRNADFSGMCKCNRGDVYISVVLHKAVVEVNEEGTEAAAATAVKMKLTSASNVEPFHMVVDRPFLISIVDEGTGLILFIGAINDPQQTTR